MNNINEFLIDFAKLSVYDDNVIQKIVDLLVDNGADFNYMNEEGHSALYMATLYENYDLGELLISMGVNIDDSILTLACETNAGFSYIKSLIDNGANVKYTNYDNQNALMLACKSGCNIRVIELLISLGIDVNAIDKFGKTALMYAIIERKNGLVISKLIDKADLNVSDYDGKTALDYANEHGYCKSIFKK